MPPKRKKTAGLTAGDDGRTKALYDCRDCGTTIYRTTDHTWHRRDKRRKDQTCGRCIGCCLRSSKKQERVPDAT